MMGFSLTFLLLLLWAYTYVCIVDDFLLFNKMFWLLSSRITTRRRVSRVSRGGTVGGLVANRLLTCDMGQVDVPLVVFERLVTKGAGTECCAHLTFGFLVEGQSIEVGQLDETIAMKNTPTAR